ncbi:MAG: histidine kinase [Bacteroidales bacterium]|nr:histidine kinase [Bacteroidales bacterium]
MESENISTQPQIDINKYIKPLFVVILFFFSFVEEYFNFSHTNIPYLCTLILFCFLCKFISFLIFYKYIFPTLDHNKFCIFFVFLIILIAIGLLAQYLSELLISYIFNEQPCILGKSLFDYFFVIIDCNLSWFVTVVGAFSIKFSQCYYSESELRLKQQNEKLKLESDLIKQQISSKILCDTLHNCGELVVKNNQETSSILLKFSHILRYQLYDSKREYSLLDSEIKFMNQFLEILKFNNLCNSFKINIKGKTIGILVPTLIFSSFLQYDTKVDNILCYFEIEDNTLKFLLKDNYSNRNLEPIKTRLFVVYQDNYQLTSNSSEICLVLSI